MVKSNKKRPAQGQQGPSKKRKLHPSGSSKPRDTKKTSKTTGKDRASDKPIIPIPILPGDNTENLSDQDIETFNEFGHAAAFLDNLDEKGIARSKKETIRLHKLNKPVRVPVRDDLPDIDSHSEDEKAWTSGVEDSDVEQETTTDGDPGSPSSNSDNEMPYESLPRQHHASWDSDEDSVVERLPIKLSNGQVQKTGVKFKPARRKPDEEEEEVPTKEDETYKVEDISTGARFGRRSVVDVVSTKSRKTRIHDAKEQMAGICQEILSDPENSLGLLRRLHTFCLSEISSPSHPEPIVNDVVIRKLAILSQLAVFKDIIPGYRIRMLTDKEKAEKVSQVVARTREWEQGLVVVYQQYLRVLETELKTKSELADTSLQCMCTLLAEVTHFNFRTNLIGCIIARLSRKSWDKSSDLCLNALITVLREDTTGAPSLEIVRLLNRMIKERKYNVNPEVLSCLLHLRLKTELGVRASETHVDKESKPKSHSTNKAAARRAKGKATDKPHLSKMAKKVLKEKEDIRKEMREAEVDVDKEERNVMHTETLKLVFVLYFSVLKRGYPSPLLPAALQGISKFAHLVNVDFFRDLLQVLKDLMSLDTHETGDDPISRPPNIVAPVYLCILCISTAFELLSGQGEALNLDLTDFINQLYSIIPVLSTNPDVEGCPTKHGTTTNVTTAALKFQSPSDLLFRALHLSFSSSGASSSSVAVWPAWRSASFAKRLLTAALHWPPSTATRAVEFVGRLMTRNSKLQALLSTEDRSVDGVYRPDLDDPQLCQPFGTSFWELRMLEHTHFDNGVREAARKVFLSHHE